MTIFRFANGGGARNGFHVWSATAVFGDGTTYMSGGGGAILAFNGPAEFPNIPLRLPVPPGIVFTYISIWWLIAGGPALGDLVFTVRNATTNIVIHSASVNGNAGPGLVLGEAIAAVAATGLNDEIEVIIGNPNAQGNPTEIFVRLDYVRT